MLSNTGINKIILLGQVTEHPKLNATANNQRFLYFTLVTNEIIKKGQDNIEHKEYHNIKILENWLNRIQFSRSWGKHCILKESSILRHLLMNSG